jgi:peptidoglycan/xylan/chitin deacetylase (PgdA/CDA1 family)
MKTTVLMYHDVIRGGDSDASGFRGAGPARYKLEWSHFVDHLDELERTMRRAPETAEDLLAGRADAGSWSLTFDDGGWSALGIGEELAKRGWRGHFFVGTDFVATPGFLTAEAIRALSSMNQLIGSHSCSHPARMSSLSPAELRGEWSRSIEVLSEILDRRVSIASVPGGYYSKEVARAAAAAGIEALYTSEPVRTVRSTDGCLVVGRYPVLRGASSRRVVAVACGSRLPWLRRRAVWRGGKVLKRIGGENYLKVRAAVFARRRARA